jgi:site-specific DNA recombinase
VRYVGRLIRLAFLAPDIVDAIVEGRQPANLTAEAVPRHIEIPRSCELCPEAISGLAN